jgi:hypothetical protein
LLATTGTLASSGTPAVPEDFARGRILHAGGETVGQRLTIPRDLYEWTTRADLGDIRVFNGSGEEVPYAVRRAEVQDEFTAWQSVPLFALPAMSSTETGETRIELDLDDGGTIIAVRGQTGAGNQGAMDYLVDVGGVEEVATEMRVHWDPHNALDAIGKMRISASDDLDEWRILVDETTLASLSSGEHQVRLDRIQLPASSARYLKLTLRSGSRELQVSGVDVRRRSAELPDRQWKVLEPVPFDDGYEYDSAGRFPADRVALVFEAPARNHLTSVELFSRSSPDGPWRSRGRHLFYRTELDGTVIESEPVAISHGGRYWRVELDGATSLAPQLEIGWLPDELVFLKQGAPPYLLAYGQAGLEGRQWPMDQLLERLDDAGSAGSGLAAAEAAAPQELGGPQRLEPPETPVDWRTLILWAVLLAGVAVVGGLAVRLLKS